MRFMHVKRLITPFLAKIYAFAHRGSVEPAADDSDTHRHWLPAGVGRAGNAEGQALPVVTKRAGRRALLRIRWSVSGKVVPQAASVVAGLAQVCPACSKMLV